MSIEVDLKRVLSLAIGSMLGYGPEPEIAQYALDTIEMAGYRVVSVVSEETREEIIDLIYNLNLAAVRREWTENGVESAKHCKRAAELLAEAYLRSNNGTTRG